MSLEDRLHDYAGEMGKIPVKEEKLLTAIVRSKEALYEGETEASVTWMEFLFQQAAYIQKRWWFAQAAVLCLLWWMLFQTDSSIYIRKGMGVLSSVFAVFLLPELWKNRSSESMEIEGAAYFTLQKIYAARMTLFGMVDLLLLSVFFMTVAFTVRIGIGEMILQFFLPFDVTCCIIFRSFCSRRVKTGYFALMSCIVWIAVWAIVLKESIYQMLSVPVWSGAAALSVVYLVYSIVRTWRCCEEYREVNPSWN